ncbi:MAG: hypothetical protein J0H39_13820 [Alphaproteobacteria bacterium]|nr:hypothetical protein [Alphaproteobacteria bacterium]
MGTLRTEATLRYGDDGEAEFDLEVEYGDGRIYAATGWRTKLDGLKRKHVRVGEPIDFLPLIAREVLMEQVARENAALIQSTKDMYTDGRREDAA